MKYTEEDYLTLRRSRSTLSNIQDSIIHFSKNIDADTDIRNGNTDNKAVIIKLRSMIKEMATFINKEYENIDIEYKKTRKDNI